MVCKCGIWVARTNIVGHLDEFHDIDKSETRFVESCMTALNASQDIPRPPAMQEHISGLPIHQAYQCGFDGCQQVLKEKSTRDKHTTVVHRRAAKANPWLPCLAQQLNHAEAKSYFSVRALSVPSVTSTDEIIAGVVRDMKKKCEAEKAGSITDQRLVNPWLQVTKWHLIVGDRSAAEVRALVEDPLSIPGIGQDLRTLMDECEKLIESTPLLLLRKLNTKVPEL